MQDSTLLYNIIRIEANTSNIMREYLKAVGLTVVDDACGWDENREKKKESGDFARGYISSLTTKPPGVCSSSFPDRCPELEH